MQIKPNLIKIRVKISNNFTKLNQTWLKLVLFQNLVRQLYLPLKIATNTENRMFLKIAITIPFLIGMG